MVPRDRAVAMSWGLPVDPFTAAVLLFVAAFAIVDWLRWRSKAAWFDRVTLEHAVDQDEDDR